MKILLITFIAYLSVASCNQRKEKIEAQKQKQEMQEVEKKLLDNNVNIVKQELELINKYKQDNNLQTTQTKSGLQYVLTHKGDGLPAEAGKRVQVHYTGKFLNGKIFDSSVQQGTPIEFTLGRGEVIKGWDEGIELLFEGDKAILIIPSHLAYGARGAGDVIPPHSTIVFDVELIKVLQ